MKYSHITFIDTLDLQNLNPDEVNSLLDTFNLSDEQKKITIKLYKNLTQHKELGFYNNDVYIKDCITKEVRLIDKLDFCINRN